MKMAKSELSQNSDGKRYLFFDIESATGGFGEICEFGYVVTNEDFDVIEEENILMNPQCDFSYRVLRKILNKPKYVYEKNKSFSFYYDKIKNIILSADAVFGFAVVNDVKYINGDCFRYGMKYIDYKFYDVQKILIQYDKHYSGSSLSSSLEISNINVLGECHDAKDDAYNTMKLLKYVSENLEFSIDEILMLLSNNIIDKTENGIIESVEINKMIREERSIQFEKRRENKKAQTQILKEYIENKAIIAETSKNNDNELYGMKICLSSEYETNHFKETLNIINILATFGAKYTKMVSDSNLFIMYESEKDIRLNKAKEYNVKIIQFGELLNLMKITEEKLNNLDYPKDANLDKLFNKNEKIKQKEPEKQITYFGVLLKEFFKEEKLCNA